MSACSHNEFCSLSPFGPSKRERLRNGHYAGNDATSLPYHDETRLPQCLASVCVAIGLIECSSQQLWRQGVGMNDLSVQLG